MPLSRNAQSYIIIALAAITFVTLVVSVSINTTTQSAEMKNNALVSKTTIFGFVIIGLATLLYLSTAPPTPASRLVVTASPVSSLTPSFLKNTDTATIIMVGLLVTGIFTSFITTSINLATYDAITQKNIFTAQAVIFSICILGLAFTISTVVGDDITTKETYLMMALHAAVLLSVVSLSANMMTKLAQAATTGARVLTQ